MKKVDKVKTAIVGCGMISNIYLRNLKNLFYIIDLVAVCDLNPASAEAKAHTYGVAEMAWAIRTGRPNRCSKEMALHAQEILCGLDASASSGLKYVMQSTFERPEALKAGYMSSVFGGAMRADAERSLME